MAIDNVTGIRLGVQTFKEGRNYSVGSVLGGLLSGLGLPVGVSGATAQFDITRDRITLYVSGLASVLGSNYSVDAKILLDGKARARRAGASVTARDFKLSGVGAGAYIAGLEPTELVANASVKNLKISKAMKLLDRGRASRLLRKLEPGSLDVYVAPSTIGGLLSGALAGAGISTTGDRAIGAGGYGADLPLGWQSTLPLPLPV
jgi:hypothetical protein